MSALATSWWALVAAINLTVGNVAIGTMCCAYVVYCILDDDDEDEEEV